MIASIRTIAHTLKTYWRQDGQNHFVFYAGNENVAVFHIDAHRSTEAAQVLLGDRIDGLLVTDAYAAYNAITVQARQSCLAHLLRRAHEIGQLLEAMDSPDPPSAPFLSPTGHAFQDGLQQENPCQPESQNEASTPFPAGA